MQQINILELDVTSTGESGFAIRHKYSIKVLNYFSNSN